MVLYQMESGDNRYGWLPTYDIIENNDYQKKSEKRESEVKRLLRDYSGITGKLRQELEELGFVITEDGKHYKITYYGDERYQAVFGKTPSDVRSGKNNAATVAKIFYWWEKGKHNLFRK